MTESLKKHRSFVMSAGGYGLSGLDKKRLWDSVVTGEREALHGTGRQGPMEAAFPDAEAFLSSLRVDADRCMDALGWCVTDFDLGGQKVVFYSRDLIKVLVEAVESAAKVQILGARRYDRNGNVIRSGTLDSDVYLDEQARVVGTDADNRRFFMAGQLFSDAALVSWSGGKLQDPVFRTYRCDEACFPPRIPTALVFDS